VKHDRLNASGIVVAVFLSALVGTLLGRSVLQFLFMSQSFNNAVASHAAGAFLLMTLAYLLYDCYTHRHDLVASVRMCARAVDSAVDDMTRMGVVGRVMRRRAAPAARR
jgi:hypothetical protein